MITSAEELLPIVVVLASSPHLKAIRGRGIKLQHLVRVRELPVEVKSVEKPITLLMVDIPKIVKFVVLCFIVNTLLKVFKAMVQLEPANEMNCAIKELEL